MGRVERIQSEASRALRGDAAGSRALCAAGMLETDDGEESDIGG